MDLFVAFCVGKARFSSFADSLCPVFGKTEVSKVGKIHIIILQLCLQKCGPCTFF